MLNCKVPPLPLTVPRAIVPPLKVQLVQVLLVMASVPVGATGVVQTPGTVVPTSVLRTAASVGRKYARMDRLCRSVLVVSRQGCAPCRPVVGAELQGSAAAAYRTQGNRSAAQRAVRAGAVGDGQRSRRRCRRGIYRDGHIVAVRAADHPAGRGIFSSGRYSYRHSVRRSCNSACCWFPVPQRSHCPVFTSQR